MPLVDKDKRNEYMRAYYKRNADRMRAYERARWAKKPRRHRKGYHLEHRYGITINDYELLLAQQEGHCALCPATTNLCVDHNHETGQVRGILCKRCNTCLGAMGDNAEGVRRWLEYLEDE